MPADKGVLAFDEVAPQLAKICSENVNISACSYQPRTGSIFDDRIHRQARLHYEEAVKLNGGLEYGQPLYVISISNHLGYIDRGLHSAWENSAYFTPAPMFGIWTDFDTKTRYLDVPVNLQFKNDKKALDFAKLYAQAAFIKIHRDGRIGFVHVDFSK